MPNRTTLVIAHSKELIRAGLRELLAKTAIRIVGEADDPKATLALVKKLRPNVLLMDVSVAHDTGTDFCDLLADARETSPETKVIGMSVHENPTYLARAVVAGAADFIWKGFTGRQLVTAIEQAAAGKAPVATGPLAGVVARMKDLAAGKSRDRSLKSLPVTPRELQVLAHVAYGLSNDEIARALRISVDTVKEHVQTLLRKLAVPDRTAAAVLAVRSGVV